MVTKERIELHCHSKCGGDALMYPGEIIAFASDNNMPAVAITDTGNVIAFVEMEQVWNTGEYFAKPIFGMQAIMYSKSKKMDYEVSILIKNEQGKDYLYRLISQMDEYKKYSSVDEDAIFRCKEGLLIGTGSEKGIIYKSAQNGATNSELKEILLGYDYIEILPGSKYIDINKRLIDIGKETGIPVVAISDARYLSNEDENAYKILSSWEGKKEIEKKLFLSTEQMLDAFSYLPEELIAEVVVENTYKIADQCNIIKAVPDEKFHLETKNAENNLEKICREAILCKYQGQQQVEATNRLEFEIDALRKTGLTTLLLLIRQLIDGAECIPEETSMRGVAVNSIVVYLLGLSDIDPINYGLNSEMAFGFDGKRSLDININVCKDTLLKIKSQLEKNNEVQQILIAGTITSIYPPLAEAIIEEYEAENGVFISPDKQEQIIAKLCGIFRGRGQHPGQLILIPRGIEEKLAYPTAISPRGDRITYFDYHYTFDIFDKLNVFNLSALDLLKELERRTGVIISDVPSDSEESLELFLPNSNGDIEACDFLPEFANDFMRNVVELLKPRTVNDLIKISGLAHGTGTWDDTAKSLVTERGMKTSDLLASREDVFEYLLEKGIDRKTAFEISESVRKGIISRAKSSKWQAWKKLLFEHDVDEWFIWYCERVKYLFPKGHSISYIRMNMRLGWYYVHYPDIYKEIYSTYREDFVC